jgi:acetyl-CoA carboxylase biotin carboxylase subunit
MLGKGQSPAAARRSVQIRRVLVANRGEIARRIMRSCRRLGVGTVAVYSEADRGALHVREADAAVEIGPPPVTQSYLRVDAILDAARRTGADAVHPGYGLLSENAGFAEAVEGAGLSFIGPSPETIRRMGSKLEARRLAEGAGVPVLPATGALDPGDPAALAEAAERVGFPVLVKLSGGGGGIGMTRVDGSDKLLKSIEKAARRGESAFGDGTCYLERAVERARHVEVQVLGDAHGNVVHLFERDCSTQRRHQKVIEESPAPGLGEALRERICEAALRLARAVGYRSAGTVEFLLAPGGGFYLLEMNTRIQVEHPVTEMLTGLDLVELQLRVAEGESEPVRQEDVATRGHAIEARLYAEDPVRFLPHPGTVEDWQAPEGPGLRVDHALEPGMAVAPYYDPLLAKIAAWGEDRATAVARLTGALDGLRLSGLVHNGPLLREVLASHAFRAGAVHTGLIEQIRRSADPSSPS